MENGHLLDAFALDATLLDSVLSALSESHIPTFCANVAVELLNRFMRTGSIDDIDQAIKMADRSVQSTPEDHPDRVKYLNTLGIALQKRFERMGAMDDIDRAIVTKEQAVKSTPDNHPDRAKYLNNLGNALRCRFERTGLMDDINSAIMANEQAVKSTPDDHLDHAIYLGNLGNALQGRFKRMGSIDDLDHAIVSYEQAVKSTPDDHPHHPGMLSNLGNALWSRFERIGSMDDLDCAIVIYEQAIESTPDDHPDHVGRLSNLGIALQSRFERTGSMADLDRAIEINEQAVKSIPDNHPDRAIYLNNLGNTLQSRFERIGLMDDLNRAIMTNKQTIESTPDDHPDRAMYLNNLGNALQSRFERTRSMDDLNRAIVTVEQAVESTPDDHPDRAEMLINLGNALQERMGSMDDRDRAIMTREQALKSDTAPPSVRLKAASLCSDLLISQRDYNRAKPILQAAVQLLPTISPRELQRSDQQFLISQFANITSRAVSLQLADADDPYKSLQSLELGRGILANLQLEVRSDISVLMASHPDLAKQFKELRDQIDSPSRSFESSVIGDSSAIKNSISILDSSKSTAEHHARVKRFDDLLRYIRSLHGLENFLQGPSESELHSLAEDGPIVVFNVSDIRSDAFLITTDEIRAVHLPLLTSGSMKDSAGRLFGALDERHLKRYNRAMHEVNAVLEWLWDVAVSPVLEKLGFTQMPPRDGAWPRTALDRVISSYAPTVKSLAYARERAAITVQDSVQDKVILVSMITTPEQKSLPFVKTEITDLETLFSKASIDTRIIQNPTRAETLSELPKHTIVHFACHGNSAVDPSQSSFLLEDWKTNPLTVSDLTSLNIKFAKLAYLSACHTSTMRNFRLLDESITLSSAVQLSGYPSVVGTLWRVDDSHSAEVARDFYAWMLKEGELDVQRSAEGLHRAVRDLRNKTRSKMSKMKHDPLIWAPFVHVGI